MLSIGEIAHSTGVSRRMLRHWERLGLVEPASLDESTGYRRYADSQVGRVRAVASLRALGFGLERIADLLEPGLTESRLVELLRGREQELVQAITEDSARLAEVRSRLAALDRGSETVMRTLEIVTLPGLRLRAVRAEVRDETEISQVAGRLITMVRARSASDDAENADIVLLYDGTSDESIVVTAGTAAGTGAPGPDVVEVPPITEGVSVTFTERPADVGDAWITLDAALHDRGLRTVGVYRQINARDGSVTLQAGVRPLR